MSTEPLVCVMWKSKRIKDTYDVGWLITNLFPFIMLWGSVKDEQGCKELSEEIVRDRGGRYIVRYDKEIESNDDYGLKGIISIDESTLNEILFGEHTTVLNEYPIKRKVNEQ